MLPRALACEPALLVDPSQGLQRAGARTVEPGADGHGSRDRDLRLSRQEDAPLLHERPPFEQVRSPAGGLHPVRVHVCERQLADLPRGVGPLRRPITEARAEPVRHGPDPKVPDHLPDRRLGEAPGRRRGRWLDGRFRYPRGDHPGRWVSLDSVPDATAGGSAAPSTGGRNLTRISMAFVEVFSWPDRLCPIAPSPKSSPHGVPEDRHPALQPRLGGNQLPPRRTLPHLGCARFPQGSCGSAPP